MAWYSLFSCVSLVSVWWSLSAAHTPNITLIRTSLGSGFHRDLVTTLRFAVPLNPPACFVLLRERLPQGAFPDPHKLSAQPQHIHSEIFVLSKVDVEAHTAAASPIVLLAFASLPNNGEGTEQAEKGDHVSVWVPLTLRYHDPAPPGLHQYAEFVLPNPELLLRCGTDGKQQTCVRTAQVEAPCSMANESLCLWCRQAYHAEQRPLLFSVPVGSESHLHMVATMTFATVTGCTLLLLWGIAQHL
uniref:phosphatidylinositol-glycan biosynthesis class X protein isoform X2 n=1 Tax=Myxine glutinosa TaxID=7769 RepID=UPI00358E8ED0